MTNEQRQTAVEMFKPEALDAIAQAKKNITTKDGYGSILFIVSGMPKMYASIFIDACIANGYPADTANQVKQIIGIEQIN